MFINIYVFIFMFKYFINRFKDFSRIIFDVLFFLMTKDFRIDMFNYNLYFEKIHFFNNPDAKTEVKFFKALDELPPYGILRNYNLFCLFELSLFTQNTAFKKTFFGRKKIKKFFLYDFFVPKVDLFTAFVL